MTDIIYEFFNPDFNPVMGLIYNAFNDIGSDWELDSNWIYFLSLATFVVFLVLSVWLAVKVISWSLHLLGIGGN